jgi:hypothetical protein
MCMITGVDSNLILDDSHTIHDDEMRTHDLESCPLQMTR